MHCFQVGDDGQEDPIELEDKKELGEEANPENMRQYRHVDRAQKVVDRACQQQDTEKKCNSVCRQAADVVDGLAELSTGARACRQLEVRIRFRFSFQDMFKFLFSWTPNITQFLFNEDLFLKFKGFRILLN